MRNSVFHRAYSGEDLPPMAVAAPVYKPQSAKQRGVQPDKTLPSQNQWFTKSEIARRLIETTRAKMQTIGRKWNEYCIVEPAAGDGRFFAHLPPQKRIGLDLHPQTNEITRADFLRWQPPRAGKYVVIGNPPFGVRGDLADAFIRRSGLFADICAFILPIGYLEERRSYFAGFDLIHSEELPAGIFVNVLGHESKAAGQGAINTCFNIWAAGESQPPVLYDYVCDAGVSVAACNFPQDPRGFISAHDVFVKARYYGQPTVSQKFSDVKSRKSHYVVGINVAANKRETVARIKKIDWRRFSTKAMNGSFSITLKKAREAMHSIGLARRVVKNGI